MRKTLALIALSPGAALAHGGHAPVPEALHAASHALPVVAVIIVALAIGLAALERWRP